MFVFVAVPDIFVWGILPIIKGHRFPFVAKIAFSVEVLSFGRPKVFHTLTSNGSANLTSLNEH